MFFVMSPAWDWSVVVDAAFWLADNVVLSTFPQSQSGSKGASEGIFVENNTQFTGPISANRHI